MTSWNGSYLGELNKKDVVDIKEYEGDKYVYLTYNNTNPVICQMKYIKNAIPCIMDEIKPFFKLFKYGTHYAKLNNRLVMFTKCHVINDVIIVDTPFTEYAGIIDDEIKNQIRYILVFRNIMGLQPHISNSIYIRQSELFKPYPIICPENNIGKLKNTITQGLISQWIKPLTLDDVVQQMLELNKTDQASALFKIRSKIDKVILRIDKNLIYLSDQILERLTVYLNN